MFMTKQETSFVCTDRKCKTPRVTCNTPYIRLQWSWRSSTVGLGCYLVPGKYEFYILIKLFTSPAMTQHNNLYISLSFIFLSLYCTLNGISLLFMNSVQYTKCPPYCSTNHCGWQAAKKSFNCGWKIFV